MSLYEDIHQILRKIILEKKGSAISPTFLAQEVFLCFGDNDTENHLRYGFVEYAKDGARSLLRKKYNMDDGAESESYQHDMFSGLLQDRYPIPYTGDNPVYVPVDQLTLEQIDWNIAQLLKSAESRIEHADALQAYRDRKASGASGEMV